MQEVPAQSLHSLASRELGNPSWPFISDLGCERPRGKRSVLQIAGQGPWDRGDNQIRKRVFEVVCTTRRAKVSKKGIPFPGEFGI